MTKPYLAGGMAVALLGVVTYGAIDAYRTPDNSSVVVDASQTAEQTRPSQEIAQLNQPADPALASRARKKESRIGGEKDAKDADQRLALQTKPDHAVARDKPSEAEIAAVTEAPATPQPEPAPKPKAEAKALSQNLSDSATAGTAAPAKPRALSSMKGLQGQTSHGFSATQPSAVMGNVGRRDASERMRAEARKIAPPPPSSDVIKKHYEAVGRDQFEQIAENPIKRVTDDPVSTFSIDVDTASYAFMRRMLNRGVLPQKNSVRVEELINYFDYDYPPAASRDKPFKPTVTITPSPWKKGNKLVHIGIKGYELDAGEKPRSNLVFLLDVSGSMNAPDKMPLMVNALKLLLDTLGPEDTVGIVVYAGAAGTVLEPTAVAEKGKILAALDRLRAGGSTAGAAGIRQAYALAQSTFDDKAVNRVILATDGDFNVGITNREELKGFVERKRKTGIFLSVLGFGQGNLNDRLMQTLAQNGNGVAAHIDTLNEARKVLVDEASSTLFPIAKDVKIQVEFNPATVTEYRLIGYETRALKREDFRNDKVDAGDIGAGHTVTAIYEITPVEGGEPVIGGNRYRTETAAATAASKFGGEYAFLKIRYKQPKSDTSSLITLPITTAMDASGSTDVAAREARWATAVAGFGQLLKGGKYTGDFAYADVIALAKKAKGEDEFGYRAEFINLARLAGSASALPRR